MARKKKMTAFKKDAVVFQSKRGRVLKKRHSVCKDLPKVKGVKGENTTFVWNLSPKSTAFYFPLWRLARFRRISAFILAAPEPWSPVI